MLPASLAALTLLLGAPFAVSDEAPSRSASFPELFLELELPPLEALRRIDREGQVRAIWLGKLGRSSLVIRLEVISRERLEIEDPDAMLAIVARDATDPAQGGATVVFDEQGCVQGEYGWAPYAARGRARRHDEGGTRVDEEVLYLCGLTPEATYVLSATCTPPLLPADMAPLEEFFRTGVRYTGLKRDTRWSEEEARARFLADAPEAVHDDLKEIVRSKHYLILTNSYSGKKFGAVMDECYAKVKAVFPFEECGERRLLPVFLFKTSDDYFDFTVKMTGWPRSQAQGTKGHAYRDYYATWFDALNDPVHLHEAVHQIFSNRLGLTGGGSWFQEGVAEYVSTRRNDRNAIATQVKKGRHMPLREFVQVRTLAFDLREVDGYKQAALLIEFLCESKFGKQDFQRFVHAMGSVQRNDLEAIERVFREVYEVDLDGLEREFQDYCKKR